MGKVLKIIAGVAIIATAIITGGGSLGLLGLTVSKGALIAIGATVALGGVTEMMMKAGIPKSQLSRLNVSLDPSTPRKAVFGTTAMNLDLRYHEASGTNQEYIDYIIALSAHKVKSIDEIWFEDKQAWTSGGGVTSTYTGYLTVATRTEGTSANTIAINGGSNWGSSTRLTGCAYVHFRIKRTGADSKTESPLVNGLPSRVTIIGDGALLYDPRKDSTVPGGSGAHRVNDQSTWGSYTAADDTDNPALQLLWWLLGWKINGELSIGCGVPAARIDLESFITAANICDENVTLAIGGTQKRYRTSGTATDADDRMSVINTFLASMNGTLRDNGGRLSLDVMKNDLADYVLDFDENDVLGEFEWNQTRGLSDSYNKARGRYVDPSTNSLYQLVDYPEVGFESPDGIERVMTLDLPYVEDGRRAQRIAKQVLERNQYRGMFSATFTAKAMGCSVGDVVRLSFETLGWSNKLFRVVSQEIRPDGQVPLALVEESPLIYLWDADDVAPVSPNAPTVYNPLNSPFILGTVEAGTTAVWDNITGTGKPEDSATRNSPAGVHSTSSTYLKGDIVRNAAGDKSYIAKQDVPVGIDLTNTTYWELLVQGTSTPGADGAPAISGYLTNESVTLFAYANGNVVSYATATGSFVIFSGSTDISSSFTLSVPSGGNPQSLTVSFSGRTYSVTGGFDTNEDNATLTIRATGSGSYSSVVIDKVFTLSKAKGGYEIVSSLPSTDLFEGRVVYLTTDDKLYRYTGGAWTAAVPATDITGTLADSQIAAVAASKVTGQLTNSQLEAIAAAKVTGQITGTQITDSAITTAKIAAGAVTTNEIAANTITAGDIASGTITATQIAAGTITGAKIAAGTIEAVNIASGTITAGNIAAGTITADRIASGTITADRIAAGTITAAQLATTQLISVSAQIGDLVVDTINIKNNSITQAAVFSDDSSVTASASWQTVASVTSGTLAGSNVKIDFSARLTGMADTTSVFAQFRILRGATVIRSGVLNVFQAKQVITDYVSGMQYDFYQPVDSAFPMFHLDLAIPAGPHTYSFQILGTSAVTISERQMVATELRR